MTSKPVRVVPFFDAARAVAPLRAELLAAAARVLDSGRFILGPEVDAFERELTAALTWAPPDTGNSVGVSCGTDALILALRACDVGPGDEVIVPALTFLSPASAVLWVGATPIFADIEPEHLTLDPARVAELITPRTRAVIPVHLFGHPADMQGLSEVIAGAPQPIAVIEDAAQALGARYAGQSVGTLGEVGIFSFFPTKNLAGFGDGGVVTCRDPERAARLRRLRVHGCVRRGHHAELGLNARLDPLQAAMLRVQLAHLEAQLAGRRARARAYLEALRHQDRLALPPAQRGGEPSTFNQFVIRTPERDALRAGLEARGVGTQIYYRTPLPEQPIFAHIEQPARAWPVTEAACRSVLALPIGPGLDDDDTAHVLSCLSDWISS